MKNLFTLAFLALISLSTYSQDKLSTTSGHIKFFSTTPVEDIEANNYKVISNLTPSTGLIVFSVPMQSFEFPKAKMQQHYNSKNFLNTKKFPKGKFKGTITNLSDINFSTDGTYAATVTGKLTIHGITNDVTEKIKFTIADGKVDGMIEFDLVLADYGVIFTKGKPSKNIAKTIKITAHLNYSN
ncbi:MAG: YceI family protein [Flavobacteriaceae bacterium]|nr:YceI family protein [Flavobacteriaceae bacterium]